MANLKNRQQAQAQQAQAFLQMDMANLDNEQQAVMFEAQSLVQSVFSDQAAENAASELSGVNMDDEAAQLIEYQQAYQASARVLQTARELFDTLIDRI